MRQTQLVALKGDRELWAVENDAVLSPVVIVRGVEDRPWVWVKPAVPPCTTRANNMTASKRARFRHRVVKRYLVTVLALCYIPV